MRSSSASSSGGAWPPSSATQRRIASPAPLRRRVPSRSTPLIRVCAVNGTKLGRRRGAELVLAQPVLLGQHDDRAALRRLVGQRGELRGLGQVDLADAGHRDERRGLAVAERDRARSCRAAARRRRRRPRPRGPRAPARCGARGGPCRRCRSRTAARRSSSGSARRAARSASTVETSVPAKSANGRSATTTTRKMSVRPASRMPSAISFGVLRRAAPSTSPIIRSRNDCPGSCVISTTMRSDSTRVPPVTAERSPPASRMTGADSPVIADSSTEAMPSTTVPSPGMTSPASTTTTSPRRSSPAGFVRAVGQPRGRRRAHRAQRRGLRLAAALGDRLGEVAEDHGQPQPDRDGQANQPGWSPAPRTARTVVNDRADLDHEHDRVADHGARVELAQRRRAAPEPIGDVHRASSASRARLSSSTLTPGLAEDAEPAAVGGVVDELEHALALQAALPRDARGLDAGVLGRDVRVDARGRGRHRVGGISERVRPGLSSPSRSR